MSLRFGPIRQLGYLTRDIHACMDHFVQRLGIGPWFFAPRLPIDRATYRDREVSLDIAVAIANSGALQIELIQPNDSSPSLFQELLARTDARDLPHHVSTWPEDYDAALALARQSGLRLVQEGFSPRGRFGYLIRPEQPDIIFEFGEYTPARQRIFAAVEQAAATWDGTEPVRTGFPSA